MTGLLVDANFGGISNPPHESSRDTLLIQAGSAETLHESKASIVLNVLSRRKRLLNRLYRITGADRYTGWRLGVFIGCYFSLLALLANLGLLIWGLTHDGPDFNVRTLASGSSRKASAISTAYHVLVNVLATIVLSASNYCMQVLSSPTRKEVDKAHERAQRLDVGIVSVRNLKYISKLRRCLWWILLLSSFPLHLFYNSTISDVTSGREYSISVENRNASTFIEDKNLYSWTGNDWFNAYSTRYVPDHGNLYLSVDAIVLAVVINTQNGSLDTVPSVESPTIYGQQSLIPVGINTYYSHFRHSDNEVMLPSSIPVSPIRNLSIQNTISSVDKRGWAVFQNMNVTLHVAVAKSTRSHDGSKVQLAVPFMIIVIICNVLKVLVMWYMLKNLDDTLLVTIGDAIQSFLRQPDTLTIGYCMLSEEQIQLRVLLDMGSQVRKDYELKLAKLLARPEQNYSSSHPRHRLILPLVIVATCITVGPLLLIPAFKRTAEDDTNISRHMWGTASQLTMDHGLSRVNSIGILYNTWQANVPQVLLSSLYFFINRFLTRVASAVEWSQWARHRKYLRVSKPEGNQRSTHFLQLPYRIALPAIMYSGVLHWLLSQSLFLRRLEIRDQYDSLIEDSYLCTVGYSPLSAMVFVTMTSIGAIIVLVQCAVMVPVKGMPYRANSSFVTSAACHPPRDDVECHLKPLKWGVVRNRFSSGSIEHCALTSEEVTTPLLGTEYA